MRRAYFDASAIVKLAHHERESPALIDFLADPLEASTSSISEVEVKRALRRQGCDPRDVDEALRGFFVLRLSSEIRRLAIRMDPLALRSLDAVHLASALSIGDADVEFLTYDDRLASVARTHGLRVVQPGNTARARPAARVANTRSRSRVR